MHFPDDVWYTIKEYCFDDYIDKQHKIAKITRGIQNEWLEGKELPQPLAVITHTGEDCKIQTCSSEIIKQFPGKLHCEFSIESIDNIEQINFTLGGQRISCIYPRFFECLWDIFDIPKYNENGYIIIPTFISKLGIPYCRYHDLVIEIFYYEQPKEIPTVQYKTKSLSNIDENIYLSKTYLTYNLTYTSEKYSEILIRGPVNTLIVKTTEPWYSLKFDKDIVLFKKTKQIGDYGIFSIVNINDTLSEHYKLINFDVPLKITKVDKSEVATISTNGLGFMGGMGALLFS